MATFAVLSNAARSASLLSPPQALHAAVASAAPRAAWGRGVVTAASPSAGSASAVAAAICGFLGYLARMRRRRLPRIAVAAKPRARAVAPASPAPTPPARGPGRAATAVAQERRPSRASERSTSDEGVAARDARTSGRRTGVVLLNIGTPASTSVEDVRDYLGRFLADDRVIEITPRFIKAILLQILLATRPKSSAENYARIWDPVRGSPLLFHSEDLKKALQKELGDQYLVRIGMSYSKPFVQDVLKSLAAVGVDDVLLVPMFPHYASSTTGSLLAMAYSTASRVYCTPYLRVLSPFYDHPLYLDAMRETVTEAIGERGKDVDHVLFSFHGLPEAQCTQTDDTKRVCLRRPDCCGKMTRANRNCYRAQCFESARLLARELGLEDGRWSIGFQSRLTLRGTIQWIRPYTDEAIADLARRGVRRLALLAPSFTADCVETLEELGIQGREEFAEAGGEELVLVPCLNSSPEWVRSLAQIVRDQVDSGTVSMPMLPPPSVAAAPPAAAPPAAATAAAESGGVSR